MKMIDGLAIVRVGSHSARRRLDNLIGGRTQGFFSWRSKGEWRGIPPEKVKGARELVGITVPRSLPDDIQKCIDW